MLRFWVAVLLAGTLVAPAVAQGEDTWVTSWAAAQQGPYPKATLAPGEYAFLGTDAIDQSFRMIVHLTAGGTKLRVRLSNLVGSKPVTFDGLHVGIRTRYSAVNPSTSRTYTFNGQPNVTIPPGQIATSDPVELATKPGDDLAVSFHIPGASGPMTFHGTSFATSYVSGALAGDITANDDGAGFSFPILSWFFVEGVDVAGGPARTSIVAFGDSITDGFFTNFDTNTRWPDLLAKKLGNGFGVANAGIGGNSISTARNPDNDPFAGPPGVDRFQHDALDVPNVRTVILLEGINDLSLEIGPDPVIEALTDVTDRAHAAGLCVVGATLLPRADGLIPYSWDRGKDEPARQAVNAWMRSAAAPFDVLADTDMALRWPDHPEQLNPKYEFADRVHLNTAGRQAIADTMPLDFIRECAKPKAAPCARPAKVRLRLPRGLRNIRVRAGGRTRRIRRGARRVVLKVPANGPLEVRVKARRPSGKRFAKRKTYTFCG